MPIARKRATASDMQDLVEEVTNAYVHRLFPDFRPPAYLACPHADAAAGCIHAIVIAAEKKGVEAEVIAVWPAPADTLHAVTARLRNISDRDPVDPDARAKLMILDGFDRLEGDGNDEPTYPFRSRFQFDREHLWLFVGQDWRRLVRMFSSSKLPLYHAASDITPQPWR